MAYLEMQSIEGIAVGNSRYQYAGSVAVGTSDPLIIPGFPNRPKTISLYPGVGSSMSLELSTSPINLIKAGDPSVKWTAWTEGFKTSDYQTYTYANLSAIRVVNSVASSFWEVSI